MTALPFPALVGLEMAQQALILLAIDPRLRGVVLSAPAGTGKSSLARGIRQLAGDEDMPFVELPASVDAENLLGGLDLEATLRSGQVVIQPGILARADGGIVYVDGINLLTDGTANLLLSVIDEGVVTVEREGISRQSAARISLIGSYDPAEGMPRQHLLDRIGMIVTLPGAATQQQRERVLRHNLLMEPDAWAEESDFVRGMILAAREHLPDVTISPDQMRQLSAIALQYGVEGHRTDLFAVRVACAAAAGDLRDAVEMPDIELAVRLVILPRATRIPVIQEDAPPPPPPSPEAGEGDQSPEEDDTPPPDPPEAEEDGESRAMPEEIMPAPEQILEAIASDLPEVLEELPFANQRRGSAGSRGTTDSNRGRMIRSVPGDPRRSRIDVIATLRAAAPWQGVRQATQMTTPDKQVYLQPSDIRVRRYRSKAGALFCFAVDASGSMALHRMRQAKGAVHHLLEKAYVKRDRVALLAFRGEQAELLMPPTQSVELARRALDLLPTGGGTPLASALILGCDVAQQARMRGIMQTVLILLTDGRANIPLHAENNAQDELQKMGGYVRDSGVRTIVIDTRRSYLSRGEARQLAEWLGGDYAYLPGASGEQIGDYVAGLPE